MGERPNTILAAVDPAAASSAAVDRALWLASRIGAPVELFACDYKRYTKADGRLNRLVIETDRARLQEVADRAGAGVPLGVAVRREDSVEEGVTRRAVEIDPLLVVKETGAHSALEKTLFSNTDWKLIERCPAPFMLVKDRAPSPAGRVMASVDPLEGGEEVDGPVIAFARRLADLAEGELHLLHAFDAAPVIAAEAMTGAQAGALAAPMSLVEQARERHREAFARLVEAESLERSRAHLVPGDVVEALVSSAEDLGIDFVVMGITSSDVLKRLFVGHTAERVLDRLAADLVVVKPEGFPQAAADVGS